MTLCLGPTSSGKTLLLKKLQKLEEIGNTSNSVPTVGINIFTIRSLEKDKDIIIKELGGGVAPIWKKYLNNVHKIIYVVDASNLCQISAAGILLYSLLADPRLHNVQILLALTKMDVSYRQMRNEALLMLQYARMREKVHQTISVLECSAVSGEGIDDILKWIFQQKQPSAIRSV